MNDQKCADFDRLRNICDYGVSRWRHDIWVTCVKSLVSKYPFNTLFFIFLRLWRDLKKQIQFNKTSGNSVFTRNPWTIHRTLRVHPMGYVGVSDGCWWQFWDLGDWFGMLVTNYLHSKSHQQDENVTKIIILPPTSLKGLQQKIANIMFASTSLFRMSIWYFLKCVIFNVSNDFKVLINQSEMSILS